MPQGFPDPENVTGDFILTAQYGYLWWIATGPNLLGNPRIGDFQCALGAFGQAICIYPKLNRVLVQQTNDVDFMGYVAQTAYVAFDNATSFDAETGTNGHGSGGEWWRPSVSMFVGCLMVSMAVVV